MKSVTRNLLVYTALVVVFSRLAVAAPVDIPAAELDAAQIHITAKDYHFALGPVDSPAHASFYGGREGVNLYASSHPAPVAVPEPSTLALLFSGALGLAGFGLKGMRKKQ